ncbi:Uncharacterized protein SCF082_LOCUS10984 [Durusdinium trenchii]|uniref:DUF4116 domain-containing protein n=1 Tax=Durusdinium trenchii TaxID=1381693 RepID=A0ABP0JA18_9DINO
MARVQRLSHGHRLLLDQDLALQDLSDSTSSATACVSWYQKSPEFLKALEMVETDGLSFEKIPEELQHDRELVLAAVKSNAGALWSVSEETERDVASGHELQHMSVIRSCAVFAEEFRGDREVIRLAARKACYADPAMNTPTKPLDGYRAQGVALWKASEELMTDRDFVLELVQINGHALGFASHTFQDDRETVMVCRGNGGRVSLPKLLVTAVKNNVSAVQYGSERLQDDKEIILMAVSSAGWLIPFVSDRLQRDPEICFAAVRAQPEAISYVAPELITRELLMIAGTGGRLALLCE